MYTYSVGAGPPVACAWRAKREWDEATVWIWCVFRPKYAYGWSLVLQLAKLEAEEAVRGKKNG